MSNVAVLLLMPVGIGLLVSYMMRVDTRQDFKRDQLRLFKLRAPTLILCFDHLEHRKPKQVALIDPSRCKVCLDSRTKR